MKLSVSKRLAALLLAVMMLLSMLPFAFAEDMGGEQPPTGNEDEINLLSEGGCTHVAGNTVNTATCVAEGTITVYCGVEGCGAVISSEAVAATGHTPGDAVSTATCTTDGVKTVSCTVCGETLSTETIPAGHSYVESITTAATCTTEGVKTFTCSACGDTYTDVISATDHSCDVVCTSTCTEAGFDVYTCTVEGCGFEEKVPADPIGHSYGEGIIDTAANCTTDGSRTFTCSNCGDTYTETIPAGHKYDEGTATTAATCTTEGVKTYTCTVCGDSSKTEVIPAGHNFVDGICTVCGEAEPVPCSYRPDCAAEEHTAECIKGNVDKATVLFDALLSKLALSDTITDEVRESVYLQMYSICGLEDNYRAAWASKPEFAEYQTSVWNVIVEKLNLLVNDLPAADSITGENFDIVKAQYDKLMLLQEAYRQYWYRQDREPDFYNLLMANANFSAISEVIARGAPVTETGVENVAKIGENGYATLSEALAAANSMSGDVTITILGKAVYDAASPDLNGAYNSINFVGEGESAEIWINRNGTNGYISGGLSGNDCAVTFSNLKLSKVAGAFADDAGFMNVAFTVYRVGSVNYTNCTFPNGACAAGCPTTYTGCNFNKSHEKYPLWAYGTDVTVDGCTFYDDRGIKMYDENKGQNNTTDLTVKNSNFSQLSGKPAIVLTLGKSIDLSGNIYSNTGVLELEDNGSSNGTPVTSDKPVTCVSDAYPNGCGVLVGDKIYRTVSDAATAATSGDTVTLLHNSTETVELPAGVALDKGSFTADGVSEFPSVAKIGNMPYETLQKAIAAAKDGDTIELLADVELTSTLLISSNSAFDKIGITINGNNHSIKAVGTWTDDNWFIDIAWNVAISNLTFDGGSTGCKGVQFYTSNSSLNNVKLQNFSADKWGYTDYAIHANASELTLNGVSFENCEHGHIIIDMGSQTGKTESVVDADTAVPGATVVLNHPAAKLSAATEVRVNVIMGNGTDGNLKGHELVYKNGIYAPVKYVAQVGEDKFETLEAAIAAANGGTVTLLDDIVLSSTNDNGRIQIPEDAGKLTLNLNGHSITASKRTGYDDRTQYVFDNYADLTITGTGTISSRGIQNYGTLTITDGVTVNSVDANGGACVWGYENSSTVIQGGTFNATNTNNINATSIYSAGILDIGGGTFTSYAKGGNGKYVYAIEFHGTEASISNATVNGAHGAVSVGKGKMEINSGDYTCTGVDSQSDHCVYVSDGTLTINGGTFNSDSESDSSAVYADAGADKVEITGGTFTGNAASVTDKSGNTKITGGSFNKAPDESLLMDGYMFAQNDKGTFSPAPDTSKAVKNSTTGKYYSSLSAAVADADTQSGNTIELLGNVEETDTIGITINKPITINGNGHTLTHKSSDATNGRAINVNTEGTVVINQLTVNTNSERAINVIQKPVDLTLTNVTANAKYAVNVAASGSGCRIAVNNCDLSGYAAINTNAACEVEVTDSRLTGSNVYSKGSENTFAAIVASGTGANITVSGNSTVTATSGQDYASEYLGLIQYPASLNSTLISFADTVTKNKVNPSDLDVFNPVAYIIISEGEFKNFDTLSEAISKAESGPVQLYTNIVLTENLVITKNVSIEPNGCTISSPDPNGGKIVIDNDNAVLTIEGENYNENDLKAYRQLAPGMCVSLGSIEICKDHTGGTATCYAKAKCTRDGCGEEYGEFDDNNHSFTYTAKDNVITETCTNGCDHKETASLVEKKPGSTYVYNGSEIEPLTIAYSKGWQGGNLDSTLTYADNKDIGTATGTITKKIDDNKSVTATANFKIVPIAYTATPNNLRYVRGSGYPLSFTTNVPYTAANTLNSLTIFRANGTLVMNVPIDPNYVVLSSSPNGMTVITLSAAVMNSLEALNYELLAEFAYGAARTPFRVLLPFIFPMTGDEANALLMAAISLVAIGGAAAIVITMKKKQPRYKGRH